MTNPPTDEMVDALIREFHNRSKGLGLESMETKARRCLEAALSRQGEVVKVSDLPRPIGLESEFDNHDYADGWNACLTALISKAEKAP